MWGTLTHQGAVGTQKQDQEDLFCQQSWPQAEGREGASGSGGSRQGPATPATHTAAPPKCWLHGAETNMGVKYSENLTFWF